MDRAPHAPAATALSAASWDTALASLLPASPAIALVHSRHRHVVNLLLPGGRLVALADAELDDAPWTVRVPDWSQVAARIGDQVGISEVRLRLDADLTLELPADARWVAPSTDLSTVPTADLAHARDVLRAALVEPTTTFGLASAQVLAARARRLRDSLLDAPADIDAAVAALVGLGEGLTPSGDDLLTGLALLAAQPGMRLGARLGALRVALGLAAGRTSLLSATTTAAAAEGRARQRLHDLVAAIGQGAPERAIPPVLAIGHSSGSDILAGMTLALDIECQLRASSTDRRSA